MKRTFETMTAEELMNILTADGRTIVLQPKNTFNNVGINWFDDTKLIRKTNSKILFDWIDSHSGEIASITMKTQYAKIDFVAELNTAELIFDNDSVTFTLDTGEITFSLTGAKISIERDTVTTEEMLIFDYGDTYLDIYVGSEFEDRAELE